jgi:hypothetical protein
MYEQVKVNHAKVYGYVLGALAVVAALTWKLIVK